MVGRPGLASQPLIPALEPAARLGWEQAGAWPDRLRNSTRVLGQGRAGAHSGVCPWSLWSAGHPCNCIEKVLMETEVQVAPPHQHLPHAQATVRGVLSTTQATAHVLGCGACQSLSAALDMVQRG